MENTLGKRIAQYRKGKGLTQEQLAEQLGVSSQAVSKWENDQTCPDILLLPDLAKLLGLSVDALLSGESAPAVQVLPPQERKNPDELILHVNVLSDDGDRIRVNLPIPLVKAALEIGLAMPQITGRGMEDIGLEKAMRLVDMGLVGRLVELESAEGDTIEIVVD